MENEIKEKVNSFLKTVAEPTAHKEPGISLDAPESITSVELDETIEDEEAPEQVNEQPQVHSALKPETQAQVYCSLINGTQTLAFTHFHKKKLKKSLGEETELSTIIQLIDEVDAKMKSVDKLTPQERRAYNVTKKALAKIDRVPYNEEEREMVVDALSQIIRENNNQMPPAMAVAIILATTTTSRIVDLLID